jgi:hypothetical protein
LRPACPFLHIRGPRVPVARDLFGYRNDGSLRACPGRIIGGRCLKRRLRSSVPIAPAWVLPRERSGSCTPDRVARSARPSRYRRLSGPRWLPEASRPIRGGVRRAALPARGVHRRWSPTCSGASAVEGRGRLSGASFVERSEAWLFTGEGGAITSVIELPTKDLAFEAARHGE